MCTYHLLANNSDGAICWCPDCKVYSLQFNNIVMILNANGFEQFKENLFACYIEHTSCAACSQKRNCKEILFETKLDGMRLCFSVNDLGSLLALMQEAILIDYGRQVMAS